MGKEDEQNQNMTVWTRFGPLSLYSSLRMTFEAKSGASVASTAASKQAFGALNTIIYT